MAVSATNVSIRHEINTCSCNAKVSLDNKSNALTGAHGHAGALASSTSIFMPQMRAQHAALAFFAVRLEFSMLTSPARTVMEAFRAVCVQRDGDSISDLQWRGDGGDSDDGHGGGAEEFRTAWFEELAAAMLADFTSRILRF